MNSSIRVNLLMALSLSMTICVPLTRTLFTHEKEMILPVILPFIDPDTEKGFAINYVDQMITCIFGSCVLPATELMTCVLKNNAFAAAALIKDALNELTIRAKTEDDASEEFVHEFRNIILMILDFDRCVCVCRKFVVNKQI